MGSYRCACGKKIKFSGALLSNEEIARLCAEKCKKHNRDNNDNFPKVRRFF